MPNISGLYTALSGMNANRQILDATAHNVANQATEGYHRQRVELRPAGLGAAAGIWSGATMPTRGVDVVDVTRIIDPLAEARLVRETALGSRAASLATSLDRIESAFVEPSDEGLAALFDEFWGGWSDLATLPGDPAIRSQLLERAEGVIDGLHRADADLFAVDQGARAEIYALAADVNELAGRIAQINEAVAASPTTPNDLLDQRDLLVRQLAGLTGAVAVPSAGGQIDVNIGGRSIVSGAYHQTLDGSGGMLHWASDGTAVNPPSGSAQALQQVITEIVPRYRAALDDVAATLVSSVNGLHTTGYRPDGTTLGGAFFDTTGVTAATIRLDAGVDGQPMNIAAGAPPTPGPLDGEQARAIALLADSASGADDRYRALIADLGVEVRSARRRSEVQGQVTDVAQAAADSVGSVSIDEEMVALVAAQRGYEASARVLSTVDDLLETLINLGR